MRILVTGASGFIGRSFVKALVDRGHSVVALTRNSARAALDGTIQVLQVDPMIAGSWQDVAAECDAAITLAGEHVGGKRWNDELKGLIRSSRIRSTRTVVDAWDRKPRARILLASSATHYYGPRPPGEILHEDAGPGDSFFARTVRDWEDEANRATQTGARVVNLRMGVVLGHGSGLDYCVPLAKVFLGHMRGAANSGFSWIHHEDNVGLMLHALEHPDLHGPLNMTAPGVVSWSHFMRTLARQYGRPFTLPVPRCLARLTMGEAAELWFSGQHVHPAKALLTGYIFKHPEFEPALEDVLRSSQGRSFSFPRLVG